MALRPLPISNEFIFMLVHPFQHQPSSSPGKDSRDHTVRYPHCYLIPAILGMKMGRRMVIVVDRNDYSEETANLRHEQKSLIDSPQTKALYGSLPCRTEISLVGCRREAIVHGEL